MINQNKKIDDDLAMETDSEAKEYLNADSLKKPVKQENVSIAKSKMILAKKLLLNIKENNERLIQLLSGNLSPEDESSISIAQLSDENFDSGEENLGEARVIEGVFDGENMIGPDGKQYSVPANYASKSKLVEGDILKLTITATGTFVYKQIGPIERARVVGTLERSTAGEYLALADGKKWRLLTASVTYYKGESGDEIVILVPKNGESKWAAVENVVRKSE
ncbi:hypothetical protein HY797_03555 [Candidatus Falkowbacteria bacterium]|nr:hypothetical protein [Candidatus Falkowbacteria bacterium]